MKKYILLIFLIVILFYSESFAQTEFKLKASDAEAGDQFGISVSISGTYVIVGANSDDDMGNNSGSAYIFKYNEAHWIQETKLNDFGTSEGDNFGWSVSISGELAIVSAIYDNNVGSSFIFKSSDAIWIEEDTLTAIDAELYDHFGYSVFISGNYAVVGATGDDDRGSAYVYKRQLFPLPPYGYRWGRKAKLSASDGEINDGFGISVSINDDYAVIGAPFDDDGGSGSGSVYIFKRDGSNWIEETKLIPNDASSGDEFGRSASICGNYILVGAWYDNENGSSSGSAYVFKRSGTLWIEEEKLTASDGEEGDHFGCSVSIDGDLVVVGASRDDDLLNNSGSAYIFKRNGTSWNQVSKLTASDPTELHEFGHSVSISGDVVIVGALGDDFGGNKSGAAYIYILPTLALSTNSLNFGSSNTTQSFNITNSLVGTLTWTINTDQNWITVSPNSGSATTETDQVTVNIDRGLLSPGHHSGKIFINTNSNNDTIEVKVDVPKLTAAPATLDFGSSDTSLKFNITNSGSGTLDWTITDDKNWITVSPTNGYTTTGVDEITVTVDRSSLAPETYSSTIFVNSNGGDQIININLEVANLLVTPTILSFGSSYTSLTFSIKNNGTGILEWTVGDNQSWITVNPMSGNTTTETDQITVSVERSGLTPETYSGTVTVTSNGGNETIEVKMDVANLSVTPVTLNFGSSNKILTFSIENKGTGTLGWTIEDNQSWMAVNPSIGESTTEEDVITVTVDRTGLYPGFYSGGISINWSGAPIIIPVSMAVAKLEVTKYVLDFGTTKISLPFGIYNFGGDSLTWEINDNQPWISVNPINGSTTTDTSYVDVSVDRSGLEPNQYSGKIYVDSNGGKDSVSVVMRVPESFPETLVAPSPLKSGTKQSSYQIISIPADLDDPSPGNVLSILEKQSKKKWRLFDCNDGKNINIEYPHPDIRNFDPGVGMFLIVKESGKQIKLQNGSFVIAEEFNINIRSGWNLIGNPYNFNVPLTVNFISLNSGLDVKLLTYNDEWIDTVTVMKQWKGYAISVTTDDILKIKPFAEKISSNQNTKQSMMSSNNWHIQILAQCGIAGDNINYAGVKFNAADDWDENDSFEPPSFGEYIMLSFPHPEWGHFLSKYTTDFKSPNEASYSWNIEVVTNIPDKVTLTFTNFESVPAEYEIWLYDDLVNILQNIRINRIYEFAGRGENQPKYLKLIVGKTEFIKENLEPLKITPDSYELCQNFPNPFNPSTTIRFGLPKEERVTLKLYNIAGNEVKTLVDNEMKSKGYHVAVWDGRDFSGNIVANGVYMYKLKTKNFTQNKKMILMK